MTVDDVVIVKDNSLPHNHWPLAGVVQTYPSDNGLVRKVNDLVTDPSIDERGRRSEAPVFLERPFTDRNWFSLFPAAKSEGRPGSPHRGARKDE